jgi:hypothetical protein
MARVMAMVAHWRKKIPTHPVRFAIRQLYKVFCIAPYELIVTLGTSLKRTAHSTAADKTTTYVVVTSVIHFVPKKFTYTATRSVYSPSERYTQTLATERSIREHLPQAKIILLEGGLEPDSGELRQAVDCYAYVGRSWFARRAVDSRLKSLGEVIMLLSGARAIPRDGARYYKVSGRYLVNGSYAQSAWEQDAFSFFFIRPDFVSTRLYSFPGSFLSEWYIALIRALPYLLLDYPIEFLLWKLVPRKWQRSVSVAGVEGTDATNGRAVAE